MAEAIVKETVDVPVDRLWALVADFGDVSWMPAGTQAELEGSGAGMARIIGGGDAPIREVLERSTTTRRRSSTRSPRTFPSR